MLSEADNEVLGIFMKLMLLSVSSDVYVGYGGIAVSCMYINPTMNQHTHAHIYICVCMCILLMCLLDTVELLFHVCIQQSLHKLTHTQ